MNAPPGDLAKPDQIQDLVDLLTSRDGHFPGVETVGPVTLSVNDLTFWNLLEPRLIADRDDLEGAVLPDLRSINRRRRVQAFPDRDWEDTHTIRAC